MFKLLPYIRKYKWYAILAPLFMLLEVALELMQPKFMATIIDQGVANGDTALIWRMCVLMLATSCLAVIGLPLCLAGCASHDAEQQHPERSAEDAHACSEEAAKRHIIHRGNSCVKAVDDLDLISFFLGQSDLREEGLLVSRALL